MQLFVHVFVHFPHSIVLSQFRTNLTSIKAKTKQVLSNLNLPNVFLSPGLLVCSAVNPNFPQSSFYYNVPTEVLFAPIPCQIQLHKDVAFQTTSSCVQTKSPVLSFSSSLCLACKLQHCSSMQASFIAKGKAQQSISFHWFLDHVPGSYRKCCVIASCRSHGEFFFSEIQHCSSKCCSLNYRLLDGYL